MYQRVQREDVVRIPPERLGEGIDTVAKELTRTTLEGKVGADKTLTLTVQPEPAARRFALAEFEIAAQVMERAFDWLDAPVRRVSGKDVPMPYAANLEKLALPSVAEVIEAVRSVTYR